MGLFKDKNKFNDPIICYLLMNEYKYMNQVGFSGYERKYGDTVVSINLDENKIALAHQSWNDDRPILEVEVEMNDGWKNDVNTFIDRVDKVLDKTM